MDQSIVARVTECEQWATNQAALCIHSIIKSKYFILFVAGKYTNSPICHGPMYGTINQLYKVRLCLHTQHIFIKAHLTCQCGKTLPPDIYHWSLKGFQAQLVAWARSMYYLHTVYFVIVEYYPEYSGAQRLLLSSSVSILLYELWIIKSQHVYPFNRTSWFFNCGLSQV